MASRRARFIAMAKEREERERMERASATGSEDKDKHGPPRSESHVRRLVRRWREWPELRVAVHALGCAVGLLVIAWIREAHSDEEARAPEIPSVAF